MSHRSSVTACGVTFEIVSNIPGVSTATPARTQKNPKKQEGVFPPQDIHGPEDREMLARLAASTEDDQSADSEAAIEKYLRSVLAVENILTMDRLRQVGQYPRSSARILCKHGPAVKAAFANVQEVAVREHLAARGKPPRRCLSSPTVSRVSPAAPVILLHRQGPGASSSPPLTFI